MYTDTLAGYSSEANLKGANSAFKTKQLAMDARVLMSAPQESD